ncbi:hypothetical protein GOP47_0007587, partial [Adiantum capillus-veneris]
IGKLPVHFLFLKTASRATTTGTPAKRATGAAKRPTGTAKRPARRRWWSSKRGSPEMTKAAKRQTKPAHKPSDHG